MGTINKQSVRDEFDKIKLNFEQLVQENKVSPECKVLFHSLFSLFELILVIFSEKMTKKTSKNSSKPSSQTDKDESALPHKGSQGKGKQQNDQKANNTRTVETVKKITLSQCDQCGASLENVPCQCYERRTKIDIFFEKVIKHVDVEIKQCPRCKKTVKAKHPKDMPGNRQYGMGIQSYAVHLLVSQMISLKRVQKMLQTLIGETLSEATLLNYILRLYHALEAWELSAKAELLEAKSLHVDETSLRVNKKNHWIHTYSSGDITLKYLHKKRGKEAMEGINIIPNYKGVLIHDCWTAYLSYTQCQHGLCGSHLLRELTFIAQSNEYRWAKNMKALLQEACRAVSKAENKVLSEKAYKRLQRRYRNILTRGGKELPPIIKKTSGRRGRLAKSDAHNLWERLKKHEKAVLLFAREPFVAFTNNRAERDLRMDKVKQKVSGCFRQARYAQAYCRISSYLMTLSNKGYNPIVAIQMALGEAMDSKV